MKCLIEGLTDCSSWKYAGEAMVQALPLYGAIILFCVGVFITIYVTSR